MLPRLTSGHIGASTAWDSRSHGSRRRTSLFLTLLSLIAITSGACGGTGLQSGQGNETRSRLPTPMPSLTPTVAATAGLLRGELEDAGLRLEAAIAPVRPSEPQSLTMAPRAALRASLADPSEGFIVIYDLTDPAEAQRRATELADYLGSGFGQSNYASDTRFSVAVVDDTLIFAWWSPSRSSDRVAGAAAFEAIARVGTPVEVIR